MRSSRLLGAKLVEDHLVSLEQLDEANTRFINSMPDVAHPCFLGCLIYEKDVLEEASLIAHTHDTYRYSLVDLRRFDISEDLRKVASLPHCRATWTLPFDLEDGIYHVASSYLLSAPVKDFWQKELKGPILWYATTQDGVGAALDRIEAERVPPPGSAPTPPAPTKP
jgi:hypothetical protein